MEEWKEYKLGDLIVLSSGGTPNKSNSLYWGGDIPWISAKAMYDDYLYSSDMTITREGLNNGSKLAPVNSILLLTRGSGLFNRIPVCLVKREMAFNQDVKCIESINQNIVSTLFLFYWLMGNKQEISNILETTGIGAGKIDTERLKGIHIKLPPFQIQQVLIKFAESLMLKIEVNRRINDNLEQQAQALFKSWFVDFEPFRDQSFVESELGMIPQGWRIGTIGELLEIKYGKDHKKLSDGEIPVYGSGGLMRKCECALYNGESVLIPRKGTLNNVMYVNEAFWTVDTMFYSIPKIDNVVLFTYLYLRGKDLASMNSGSAVPSMTTEIINNMKIVIPTEMVIRDFNIKVTSIYSRIKHGDEESRRLAQLRDTLLPRLMSGELRVNEIENAI